MGSEVWFRFPAKMLLASVGEFAPNLSEGWHSSPTKFPLPCAILLDVTVGLKKEKKKIG